MTNNETDKSTAEFEARTKALLNASENSLDAERLQRLQAARREAVAAVATKPSWQFPRLVWLPVSVVAATALAIGLLVNQPKPEQMRFDPSGIAVSQDMELLEELEFVAWMVEQDQTGATDAG